MLYSFQNNGADGTEPYAGVIAVKGVLYGTAAFGGTGTCTRAPPYGCGTVFSVNAATGAETVVHSFQNDGEDGQAPGAGLMKVGGTLYGTTTLGGTPGSGTLFAINWRTSAESVMYNFKYSPDAGFPAATLLDVDGKFYGTATGGGAHYDGAVYSYDPSANTEKVVYSFCSQRYCADGSGPESTLVDVNGSLYGTTVNGGAFDGGTVFSVDPSKGSESVLYSFCRGANCQAGTVPNGSLIYVKGKLYGMTNGGGAYDYGAIFSLDLSTGKEKVLYSFRGGQDGAKPIGGTGLLKVGDIFYGTTGEGGGYGCGGYGCGTVFAFDRKSGTETVLHAFQDDGADGQGPVAGVINVDGTLYGTTVYGGTYGYGTVFEVVP